MQASNVLKGFLLFAFSATFTKNTSGLRVSSGIDRRNRNVPIHCFTSSCAHALLVKLHTDASKVCHQTNRHFTNKHGVIPCSYQMKSNKKSIKIKVRVYRPWDPMFIRVPDKNMKYRQFERKETKMGLESIMNFQKSLGPNAVLLRDLNGSVIGIKVVKPPEGRDLSFHSRRGTADRGLALSPGQLERDQCCSTYEVFHLNKTLKDVRGNTHNIMQFSESGSHQFIRHGLCGGQGLCRGKCVQTLINLSLSIHPPRDGQAISYRLFQIPGYCSCKSFG